LKSVYCFQTLWFIPP